MPRPNNAATVCVVVPVYNARHHLEECVTSIYAQTYTNLIVLLIDDGSSDGSGEICDRLGRGDSRIRVYHKANQGPSEARNFGIRKAQGDYLTFVDADDLLAPQAIEVMVAAAQSNQADLVIGGFQRFSADKKNKPRIYAEEDVVFNTQEQLSSLYCKTTTNMFGISVWGKLYNLDLIKLHKLSFRSDVDYEEDCLFNLDVFPLVKRCVMISCVVYFYRQQEASLSKGYRSDAFPQLVQGYHARLDYVTKVGRSDAKAALAESFLVVYETLVTKIENSDLSRSDKNRELQRLLDAPEVRGLPNIGLKTKMRYKQALLKAAKSGDVRDATAAARSNQLRLALKSMPGYSFVRRAFRKIH